MKKLLVSVALLAMAAIPTLAQGPVNGPYLVDHFSNNSPVTITVIQITTGSNQITVVSTAGLQVGSTVTGTGIPAGTTIVALDPTTIFLSAQAIATIANVPISFDSTIIAGKIRLVNFGAAGNPMTTPTGDVCANIYVFDSNQEMVACCSCRITPNGLLTLSVRNDLTSNVLTRIFPPNGDVKIVSTAAVGNTLCTPVTYNGGLLDSVVGFGAHVQVTGGATSITETNIPDAALSTSEQGFLTQTCQFARYLGSGFGTCSCPIGIRID